MNTTLQFRRSPFIPYSLTIEIQTENEHAQFRSIFDHADIAFERCAILEPAMNIRNRIIGQLNDCERGEESET